MPAACTTALSREDRGGARAPPPLSNYLHRGRNSVGGLSMLLLCLGYTLLENIEPNGRFVLVDDQRWRQAARRLPAAQQQQSLRKRQVDDPIAHRRSRLTAL